MPPVAFTLALAAAVLHAFWNLLLARARDPESATAIALIAAVLVFAPVTALRFDAEWAVWPFVVVTSLLQLLYFATGLIQVALILALLGVIGWMPRAALRLAATGR